MPDQIVIRGLQLTCNIGVPEAERAEEQALRVHLTMDLDAFPRVDCIDGTVDYKDVADRVVALAAAGERQLLETLAQDIAKLILNVFAVTKVRVELEKFILPETDWVGVIIERSTLRRN